MRPWLEGDLEGVDPRAELPLLRDAVLSGAHRGIPLRPFWSALAALDPVACAELAAGPRAVAHRASVEASLVALDALEGVLAPSGLYARLVELAPEAGPAVLHEACVRHPTAAFTATLCRRVENLAGARLLSMYADHEVFADVCAALASGGATAGLVDAAGRLARLEPIVALYRAGHRDAMAQAAAAAITARPSLPLVAWLAAVHGPDLDAVLAPIVPHLTDPTALRALRHAAVDFPGTLAAIDARS